MIARALAGIVVMCAASTVAVGKEGPSWRRCAIDFVANTLDLGNLRLEVPPDRLGRNAKLMADIIAKDGLATAAMQVHAAFAKCTEALVLQGPPVEPGEKLASECATGAVVRLTVLGRIKRGDTVEAIMDGLPKEGEATVKLLHRFAKEGSTKAVWTSLEIGIKCIEAARRGQG